jgi:hypothetical protein
MPGLVLPYDHWCNLPERMRLPDGTIFCFYGRGSTDGKRIYRTGRLTVARFDARWVRGER